MGWGGSLAETPGRYCSNCGQELGDAGQFCPNCGSPVHRTAHVPTPEADVPVPPPPQPGSAGPTNFGPTTQGQPAERSAARRHPILTGCLGIIVIFVLLGILSSLGEGGDETARGGGGGGGQQAEEAQAAAEGDNEDEQHDDPQAPREDRVPPRCAPLCRLSLGCWAKIC